MPKGDLIVRDEDVSKVAKAIASETRWRILKLLKNEALDVSRIAEKLGQTEANMSAQIKIMEHAGLIESHNEPGLHGVRKVCRSAVERIILIINSD